MHGKSEKDSDGDVVCLSIRRAAPRDVEPVVCPVREWLPRWDLGMRFRIVPFFALLFGLTWASHVPLAVSGRPVAELPYAFALLLGGLGPAVAATVFVLRANAPGYRRQYLIRLVSIRRVPWAWWCAVAGLPLFVVLMGALVAALSSPAAWATIGWNAEMLARITPFYPLLMLLAPLLEEVAWRGYGQDALQSRFGPVFTSLILGFVWTAWHLPLFFMNGTYQSSLGVGTPQFWDFVVWTIATTFVMTWLYNATRGSILALVTYHFLLNLANELLVGPFAADVARTAVQLALGLLVVVVLPRLRGPAARKLALVPWRPDGVSSGSGCGSA